MITRRDATKLLGAALGAAILLPPFAAFAQTASPQDLEPVGPGDIAQGPADAKVTIIEYASLTCSHCAAFHAGTYPELKKRYIDTGQVRFILREFPLDPLATAGFMLARCDGEAKYYPGGRPAVLAAEGLGHGAEAGGRPPGNDAPGRFPAGEVRSLLARPEALRRGERGEDARRAAPQDRFDPDLLHQRPAPPREPVH